MRAALVMIASFFAFSPNGHSLMQPTERLTQLKCEAEDMIGSWKLIFDPKTETVRTVTNFIFITNYELIEFDSGAKTDQATIVLKEVPSGATFAIGLNQRAYSGDDDVPGEFVLLEAPAGATPANASIAKIECNLKFEPAL